MLLTEVTPKSSATNASLSSSGSLVRLVENLFVKRRTSDITHHQLRQKGFYITYL